MGDKQNDAAGASTSAATSGADAPKKPRKPRLSQEDVPGYSLDQAIRVIQAIADNHAYKPTRPLAVAQALRMTPSSGGFRGITGAAVAYGLTTGAYNASEIGLTPIGLRIVRPTTEGDDLAARREAFLRPRVIGDFLRNYDGAALPADNIAKNVLEEMGVPSDRTSDVYEMVTTVATDLGFINEWSGKRFVDLAGSAPSAATSESPQMPGSSGVLSSTSPTPGARPSPTVAVSSGVNINIEIHIAADASTQTIEDIFRSMQRYVLRQDGSDENGE